MYFKFGFLGMVMVYIYIRPVHGFDFFGINNGIKHIIEEIKTIAIMTGAPITTRWIEQKVDHFNANDSRKWKMRYYERVNFWRLNGPIYLFLNGEAPAEPGFLTTGIMYELAKETNGVMFLSEHRYYGESQPVNRTKVEDFKYLTVSQALEDNANLIRNIKKSILFKNSKVVVIGGSYAGNLAAWMKLIYPDLVDAAIASSGPVLAKRNFFEYIEVVARDYEHYGTSGCYENIQKIFQRYDMLFQSDEGIQQLKEEENICEKSDISKPENKQLFFLTKMSSYMSNAQYGNTNSIRNDCDRISNITQEIFNVTDDKRDFWNKSVKCYYYDFDSTVQAYREEQNDYALCWTYQTCTEFGYFQSTDSEEQPFTRNLPVEWYDKLCTALFGVGFDRERVKDGVVYINKKYGGRTPNVTKVVFVNGDLDPWSALGVLEDISYNAPAVYIPRSSHCRDLFSNKESDPEEIREARLRIKKLIKEWIRVDNPISDIVSLVIPT